MPYTPPALSPGASPQASRSSSVSNDRTPSSPAASAALQLLKASNNAKPSGPPRSSSHKHRRTPSITSPPFSPSEHHTMGREAASRGPSLAHVVRDSRANGSIHPSPPPADNVMIPPQAVLSPPDSNQNSSDEESDAPRRGRDLGKLEEQLKEAIKSIPQRRAPSPDSRPETDIPALQPAAPLNESDRSETQPARPRMSHQRSYSESSVSYRDSDDQYNETISDTEEDDGYRIAPPMIRKKSGELVKSSLKSPGRSRPVSMPSTPTFPKNVHFDSEIEHVRHFSHSERPSAVSAGSSPVEPGDYEEFPFTSRRSREPSFEWELILSNFPEDLQSRRHLPVRLEKACLSTDKKNLIGTVAVVNMAFQKSVVARFTFDYWQTVSEVSAEYSNDVRKKDAEDGCDRFVFKIKLAEQANLENKTLFFCVKYCTAGQEFWDSNGGVNYQVDFRKKMKSVSGSNAGPRLSSLPKSHRTTPGTGRPRSMPTFAGFEQFDDSFFERAKELSPESLPSRKVTKAGPVEEDTALPQRRANPPGNAFGNRYDFGASLSAAIKAASSRMGPDMGRARSDSDVPPKDNPYFDLATSIMKKSSKERQTKMDSPLSNTPLDSPSKTGAGPPEVYKPERVLGPGHSIESPSYRELLDNYCFFGTAKPSPRAEPKIVKEVSPTRVEIEPRSASPLARAGSPLTVSQHKASGSASPIPINHAGFRHARRSSGALRFEAPQQSTAIC